MESNRALILQAAIRQFNAHGIQGASIAAIANDAGISKGTLYYYYQSKDSLTRDCFRYVTDNAKENLAVDLTQTPENIIKQFTRASFVWPLRNPEQMRFMDSYIQLHYYEEDVFKLFLFDILLEENLSPAMRNALRKDIPLELLNFLVGSMLTNFCKYAITNPGIAADDAFINAAAQTVWDMVSA